MFRLPRFSVLICIAIVLLFVSAGPVSASPVPQITALSPYGGPITGGTHVTITGSGFTGTTNVQFGGKSVPFLHIVNDRCLTVITPPNHEGTVPLSIINAAGTGRSREAFTRFQYEEFPLPRLSGISPSSGPAAGGTLVTITGSGFTGAENVWFREKDAWDLNVIDDNHLTVRTPAYFPGLVPISVKNAFEIGRSQEPSAMYLYEFPIPELTGISPSSGSTAGYTVVNIVGSGLTAQRTSGSGGYPGPVWMLSMTTISLSSLLQILPVPLPCPSSIPPIPGILRDQPPCSAMRILSRNFPPSRPPTGPSMEVLM